jgi:hypothetical protein
MRVSSGAVCICVLTACLPHESDHELDTAGRSGPGGEAPSRRDSRTGGAARDRVAGDDAGASSSSGRESSPGRDGSRVGGTDIDGAGSTTRGGANCAGVGPPGHRVFRAIEKLATTRDEVRVLVYGQSISEQAWWSKTKAWLEATYPNGKLTMEDHARGGCSSQCLVGRTSWSSTVQRKTACQQMCSHGSRVLLHEWSGHSGAGQCARVRAARQLS